MNTDKARAYPCFIRVSSVFISGLKSLARVLESPFLHVLPCLPWTQSMILGSLHPEQAADVPPQVALHCRRIAVGLDDGEAEFLLHHLKL